MRAFLLIHVTLPLAWVACELVRITAPRRGEVFASVAGGGAALSDVKAYGRWWLKRLQADAAASR